MLSLYSLRHANNADRESDAHADSYPFLYRDSDDNAYTKLRSFGAARLCHLALLLLILPMHPLLRQRSRTGFQPHDQSGNRTSVVLEWRIFAPSPAPAGGKGPAVVLLHEGGFMTGNIFATHLLPEVEQDLTAAGYYVYVVGYRLAPCGLIKGQDCHSVASSGRPPQQTDDVKAFVRAARADGHCNGKLGVVGGSAGASHAAFVALDMSTSTGWPNWTAADRPDVAACLSGAYDFADRTHESYGPDPLPNFIFLTENYTYTCVPNDQRTVSPVAKISSSTPGSFRPMYIINSEKDPMPFHQIIDLQCGLEGVGVNTSLYEVHIIPDSSEHAFEYWRTWDGVGGSLIHDWGYHVITFLDSYLKP